MNAAAGANKPSPVFFFDPSRERRPLGGRLWVMMMFALRGLRTAVFTEPAITQIEEVGRLVHKAEIYITSS